MEGNSVHERVSSSDWRSKIQQEGRRRVVRKIIATLKRTSLLSGLMGLTVEKIAAKLEEKIYIQATSKTDYLRKITLQMLAVERRAGLCTEEQVLRRTTAIAVGQENSGLGTEEQILPMKIVSNNQWGSECQHDDCKILDEHKQLEASPRIAAMDGQALYGWQSHLQTRARQRIISKITNMLKKHLPISSPEGLTELERIAVRFEEKIFTRATSQHDYIKEIAMKMLLLEQRASVL